MYGSLTVDCVDTTSDIWGAGSEGGGGGGAAECAGQRQHLADQGTLFEGPQSLFHLPGWPSSAATAVDCQM